MRPYHTLVLIIAFFATPVIGSQDIDVNAPSQMESELWQSAILEQVDLEQRHSVLENAAVNLYVNGIVDRLWQHVKTDLPVMQVRLLVDTNADAYVFPNGVCYVTSEMLCQTRNQDQLAMILAHEIIHYTQRHAVSVFNLTRLHSSVSHPTVTKPGGGDDLASMLDDAEQQADTYGLALMTRAGFCPDAALRIMSQSRFGSERAGGKMWRFGAHAMRRGQKPDPSKAVLQESSPCRMDTMAEDNHSSRIAPALLANARHGLERGLWELAENSIGRYLTVCPDDAQGYFIRGEIQRLGPTGENEGSPETAYLRAIEIDGAFAPAYQSMGIISFKMGHTAQAKHYFERCLALAPNANEAPYIKQYLQWCSE